MSFTRTMYNIRITVLDSDQERFSLVGKEWKGKVA